MNPLKTIPTNKELQTVKDVVASFLGGLKNFDLYPENHVLRQKCIDNVFNCLEAYLNTYDSLRLNIEKERLIYQGEIVFQESASKEKLVFFLYRDGIRWIQFNKGLKSKEIKRFLNILNCYTTVQEDPEADLVTALWEEHFSNIRYKASDINWDSEPLLELNLSTTEDAKSFGENLSKEGLENSLITNLRSSEKGLFELNAHEIAKLREMIIEEENRDISTELLGLASILLEDQANKNDVKALLQFINEEIKVALKQKNFQLAKKFLKSLHKMRLASKTKSPWAISIFNNFIKSISDPQSLNILSKILLILDKSDLKDFKLIRQFLMLLHPNAILTLAPMLSQIRSKNVQQQLIEIIEIMARRDLYPLEKLLSSNDEYIVVSLIDIAGRIPSKKTNQILLKMLHNPSERIRKQTIKHFIAQRSLSLDIIFPFIEDSSKSIRQLILDHLKQNKSEKGEALLSEYLKQKRFLINNNQHIIACYKTLGKCGSTKSIPFLKEILFKRRLVPDFRGAIHRQGSVIALIGLETNEARKLLQRASKSIFPNVRFAYKRGLNTIH
jgi:HEAT repeat protein